MSSRPQQHSATSLARFAAARQPDVDIFYGSKSRDYCNSFWGVGDNGPNIMFARMRGASKTTDELRNFWNERCNIEEEYASRLAKLAKAPIGGDEIGELRNSLDILRIETEKQAENHLELANQIRTDLEASTAAFHSKQINHRRNIQAPLERKFKEKQVQESYVKKSREKYEGDCTRIKTYTQQASYMQGPDLVKVQQKLQRTKQTIQGNERDFAKFSKELLDLLIPWEKEWKEYCDSCQDLEEDRMDFMKDIIWTYINCVSMICVADDQSCERVRVVIEKHYTERDVENFVNEYGTGNQIVRPPNFVPSNELLDPQLPGPPTLRQADFLRVSQRPAPVYATEGADPHHHRPEFIDIQQQSTPAPVNGHDHNISRQTPRNPNPPPQSNPPSQPPPPIPINTLAEPVALTLASGSSSATLRTHRQSAPLPNVPLGGSSLGIESSQTPPPPIPQQPSGNTILFYVKALYDYTATIEEEFDFQSGDVIAVTATPDDGWWTGELLDEARRVEGRNVFPSNFVCLF